VALGHLLDEDRGSRFVKQNFDTEGPKGARQAEHRRHGARHRTSRTGPGGIMEATNDIDSDGYWTVDDFEALMGLAAYRYLAVAWATRHR
jgi:hypothetical protein